MIFSKSETRFYRLENSILKKIKTKKGKRLMKILIN